MAVKSRCELLDPLKGKAGHPPKRLLLRREELAKSWAPIKAAESEAENRDEKLDTHRSDYCSSENLKTHQSRRA